MSESRPAVATFYSFKGGVGRTLLATNVAVALARRGKTLLWDLDVEAPGLHHIAALGLSGRVEGGFMGWFKSWQPAADHKPKPPSAAQLKRLGKLVRATGINGLHVLPAYGDGDDPAALYGAIDWPRWFQHEPAAAHALFEAALAQLAALGFRHVLVDARTGYTDLGGMLVAVLPDMAVLVGNYGAQNVNGLHRVWQALKKPLPADLLNLRHPRADLQTLLVASPVPLQQTELLAAGRDVWAKRFGKDLGPPLEIPYDTRLPFTEELLILKPESTAAPAYEVVASVVIDYFERLDADRKAASTEDALRQTPEDAAAEVMRRRGSESAHKGASFEERVAHLLRLLGYKVGPEQGLDSNKIDLVARIKAGLDETVYLVECKNESKPVDKGAFERLKGWSEQPEARALNARLMLVSAKGFSPQALQYARQHNIAAVTPEDLERELLDTAPYLEHLIRSFEQTPLASAYVAQRGQDDAVRVVAKSQPVDPDAVDDAPDAEEPQVLDDLLDSGIAWASGEGSRLWVLLGDYGTGKSAFVAKLAYQLALAARHDATQPLPLVVNLRFVANKSSLEEVLAGHWEQATRQRVDPQTLLHLLRRGRIVLLLDSFDEMGIATAGRSVVDQFRSLVRPAAEDPDRPGGNRVLVTCREQFFREHGDALAAAEGRSDRIAPLQGVALGLQGRMSRLLPFTHEQVRQFLRLRLGEAEAQRALDFIRNHGLEQLGDRPQLLDIIIQSLPRLRDQGGRFSVGALYLAYTEEWLSRFKPTGGQTSRDQLRSVLEMLAGVLWRRTGNRLHYQDLYSLIRERPDWLLGLDANTLDVELRTAAFLSRTPDGFYGFSHRSFLEFFLARRIEWATRQPGCGVELEQILNLPRLSHEVCSFVGDLTPNGDAERNKLAEGLKHVLLDATASAAARVNAVWLGYRLVWHDGGPRERPLDEYRTLHAHYLPTGAQLQGCDLSGLNLITIALPQAHLEGARLVGTVLQLADLTDANLRSAVLRDLDAMGSQLRGSCLDDADATHANFKDADLAGASLRKAQLAGATLEEAQVDQADFYGACLRAALLTKATGEPADLTGTDVSGATARGAHRAWGAVLNHPPLPPLAAQLLPDAHHGAVNAVAFSHDSRLIVSASHDNTVRLWDRSSGACIATLQGHQDSVTSVAFSHDSSLIASASDDGTWRLWCGRSHQLRLEARALDASWASVDYEPDPRGLWRGEGQALQALHYRDPADTLKPWPWMPRRWRAVDLPELKAPA